MSNVFVVEFYTFTFLFFLERDIIQIKAFSSGYFNRVTLKFSFPFEGIGRGHAKDAIVLQNKLSNRLKCS